MVLVGRRDWAQDWAGQCWVSWHLADVSDWQSALALVDEIQKVLRASPPTVEACMIKRRLTRWGAKVGSVLSPFSMTNRLWKAWNARIDVDIIPALVRKLRGQSAWSAAGAVRSVISHYSRDKDKPPAWTGGQALLAINLLRP
jgi:hypothetical protein